MRETRRKGAALEGKVGQMVLRSLLVLWSAEVLGDEKRSLTRCELVGLPVSVLAVLSRELEWSETGTLLSVGGFVLLKCIFLQRNAQTELLGGA